KMLDLDHLGGPAFIVEMIDTFIGQATQAVARMRAAVQADDLVTVARAAHSLKSGAANLGAERLRDAATVLEAEATQHGSATVLLQGLRAREDACDCACQILRRHRDQAARAAGPAA